jgi:hypothetical protein
MSPIELATELDAKYTEFDTRRAQAQREADECAARMVVIKQRTSAICVATTTLANLPPVAAEEEWRDFLIKARKTLCDELLALPARIRTDHDYGVQQNLKLSIIAVDRGPGVANDTGFSLDTLRLGHLMREAGYSAWFGSRPEVEERIERLIAQRNEAQAQLDDAMLDDDERAKRDAESAARAAKLNAAPVRKTRGDGSQYDRWPDGRVVEISE